MRVLITTPIFPPDLGGPAVFVPSLGRFLVERGHDVKVVAFCEDPRPAGYPFEVISIPRVALPLRYLRSFFAILRHAGDRDVVYVQEHLALLAVLAAKLRGKPVAIRVMVDGAWEIAHRYGWAAEDIDAFQGRAYGIKVALSRALQRWWWSRCDAIVAVSDYLRRIVIRNGGDPARVHLIHNAYHGPREFAESREECRAELGLAAGRRLLVTVCRLMVWKGVDGILRALRRLPDDVDLVVVGDGDQFDEWSRLARELGLAGRARFVGNRPHAETLKWIRAADVFVLHSRYEGLSHTLLEVMALGTPIVCSNVCGNPELVADQDNGLLVPFGDVDALTAALARLLADRELGRTFARRSQDKVRGFDREALFGRLERLLESLAAGRRPAVDDAAGRNAQTAPGARSR